MNQDITFLTDGGDTVRDLPLYLSPRSEHILDWFHVTMRITVIKQMSKGPMGKDYQDFEKKIESLKWFLWHGNVFQAREILESLIFDLEEYSENKEHKKYKLFCAVSEFDKYIELNCHFIPNYGERYRNGESISSSLAESTVNEVISRRMAKKQQMRWTQRGAHLLLQVRTQTLNNDLKKSFNRWDPQMDKNNDSSLQLAA